MLNQIRNGKSPIFNHGRSPIKPSTPTNNRNIKSSLTPKNQSNRSSHQYQIGLNQKNSKYKFNNVTNKQPKDNRNILTSRNIQSRAISPKSNLKQKTEDTLMTKVVCPACRYLFTIIKENMLTVPHLSQSHNQLFPHKKQVIPYQSTDSRNDFTLFETDSHINEQQNGCIVQQQQKIHRRQFRNTIQTKLKKISQLVKINLNTQDNDQKYVQNSSFISQGDKPLKITQQVKMSKKQHPLKQPGTPISRISQKLTPRKKENNIQKIKKQHHEQPWKSLNPKKQPGILKASLQKRNQILARSLQKLLISENVKAMLYRNEAQHLAYHVNQNIPISVPSYIKSLQQSYLLHDSI